MAGLLDGLSSVLARLEGMKVKGKQRLLLEVGYNGDGSAPYAIYVHEDTTKHHPIGQAKFLERAYRELAPQLKQHIAVAGLLHKGVSLEEVLLDAGEKIRIRSQQYVPVDTGALKNSAYVVVVEV